MKKILILNRRCIKHPEMGGAEVYTYKLAEALSEEGWEVEWFSSKASGLPAEERLNGIRFIRKGSELTVHFFGFMHALKRRDWVVLDEFNGIGFFTFFKRNSMLLVHQLYNEFWTAELGVFGHFFIFLERLLLRLYKKMPTITVSQSTCDDLKALGFSDITIIHNSLDIKPLDIIPEKEKSLTLAYLGRLKSTKNPEDAIKAFLTLQKTVGDARLWIMGDGPLYGILTKRYAHTEGIRFLGFIDNQEKYNLLKRAHFLLVPSIREGWGQVVIQANAMGTPAIGYNIHGLKDSIRDGETGVLVKDYREMTAKSLELWGAKEKYHAMCAHACAWAGNFSWQWSKNAFIKFFSERVPD